MQSLGINIGSTSLKMALFQYDSSVEGGRAVWTATTPHEGDFGAAVRKLLAEGKIPELNKAIDELFG
jgi:predicted NBD/HSP70 family sugar kinase